MNPTVNSAGLVYKTLTTRSYKILYVFFSVFMFSEYYFFLKV